MLFKKYLIEKILSGQKVETRRLADPRVKVGRTYAVKRNYFERREDCPLIKVTRLDYDPLGSMDDYDARREGFESLAQFCEAWEEINGELDPDKFVYIVEFELVRGYPDHAQAKLIEAPVNV